MKNPAAGKKDKMKNFDTTLSELVCKVCLINKPGPGFPEIPCAGHIRYDRGYLDDITHMKLK